jgi:hypothetical protein
MRSYCHRAADLRTRRQTKVFFVAIDFSVLISASRLAHGQVDLHVARWVRALDVAVVEVHSGGYQRALCLYL